MGRAKQKQKAKLKRRREEKRKRGLNVPFELYKNTNFIAFKNKYLYKANIYKCSSSKKQSFENIRFKSSNITNCSFKGITFKGIDFIFSNLKKSSFKNCFFEDVIFFGCNMKKCRFINCTFKNVYFINVHTSKFLGLKDFNSEVFIMNSYPNLNLDLDLERSLNKLSLNKRIFEYKVLHTKQSKFNNWILYILLKDFSQEELATGFKKLSQNSKSGSNRRFFTYYSFKDFFIKYLKK